VPPLDTPLPKTELRIYDAIRAGHTTVVVSLPTKADAKAEGPRWITLRFHVHGVAESLTSTVKVVDPRR
jgi:hypothetical protein